MLEKLAALDELHDEVDSVRLLEDIVHPNDERMVHLIQDELLNLQRLDRLVLNDDVLSNDFHGEVLVLLFVPNEINFAKGAPSNDADQLKVVESHLCDSRSPV